jgi:hypothetical protein
MVNNIGSDQFSVSNIDDLLEYVKVIPDYYVLLYSDKCLEDIKQYCKIETHINIYNKSISMFKDQYVGYAIFYKRQEHKLFTTY